MKQKHLSAWLTMIPVLLFVLLFTQGQDPLNLSAAEVKSSSFKMPEYTKYQLPTGLTVYLMEKHDIPMISISTVFPAGSIKDGSLPGLADLTADALKFGTQSFTKQQIDQQLEFLGASCRAYAGKESISLYASFMNTDQDKVFPLLKEIIMSPAFDKIEFEKLKKRSLLSLEQEKESPNEVIYSYFNKFIFGDNVYGSPRGGIKSSIEKIQADDLKNFYKENFKPAESAIAIVGDFKTAEMKEKIKKYLGDWNTTGKSRQVNTQNVPNFDKPHVLLINKEDATQTQFIIGAVGPKRNTPDYIAMQLINTVFGGRFTSMINSELRIKSGLTYGARSSFGYYKDSGTYSISTYTRTENTEKAIDLAIEVLEKLHQNGLTPELFKSGQKYLKGQFPPDYETSGSLAATLTEMYTYGLDDSIINNFEKDVDGLTLEKAKLIIDKYFPKKDKLQFVIIGKSSQIRDIVKKYGEVTEKEIKAEGF